MKSGWMIKRIKIAAVVLTAVFLGSYLPWQESGARAAQEQQGGAQKRFEIVGSGTPFSERTGKDDGASFVVHFVGDVHGSLEPCG
jgi:hypothetical protein